MNAVMVIAGALIICAFFAAMIGTIAWTSGSWKLALSIFGIAVCSTTVVTGAAFLIAYGVAA